jgi:hypothetical protein
VELERALSETKTEIPTTPLDEAAGDFEAVSNLSNNFGGLQLSEDGGISFHGPSSLLQLPSSNAIAPTSFDVNVGALDYQRKWLLDNASTERAVEQLFHLPVG